MYFKSGVYSTKITVAPVMTAGETSNSCAHSFKSHNALCVCGGSTCKPEARNNQGEIKNETQACTTLASVGLKLLKSDQVVYFSYI